MKLYVDVTNTLLAVSVTGIQRVACELLSRVFEACPQAVDIRVFQGRGAFPMGRAVACAGLEPRRALEAMRRPAARRAGMPLVPRRFVAVGELEGGSVFFDLDAVWHNEVRRSLLYPSLRSLGIAILAMHYDAVPVLHPELVHPATAEKFVPTLKAQLRYGDRLLAISRTVREDLISVARDRGWPQCEVQVVPLGSDFSSRPKSSRVASAGISTTGSTPSATEEDPEEVDLGSVIRQGGYILSVGTLEPRKNQGVLLDAFDALSGEIAGLTLVLVGRSGWLVDDLERRIADHPLLGDRLFWLKRVPDETLETLYRRAGAVVYPSLYEGYGLPVVEALAAGTVTLSSDRGALPEVASSFADFFDPTSVDQLVALLRPYFTGDAARHRRCQQLASFEPPLWASTAAGVAGAIRELGGAPRIKQRRQLFQIVYLSIHPQILRRTLAYVEHLMPFVNEAVVVTPARLAGSFGSGTSLPVTVFTDEELLGDDLELFRRADHQGKNWLLRCNLVRRDRVRDEFIMSDDDYRPLREVPSTFFKCRDRTRAYFFHDLDDWPSRAALATSYDLGLRNAANLLARYGYRDPKAFSSHCPQLIDKRIFAEMLERFGDEVHALAVDEWSIYFNHALRHHPDRFEARTYRTLCWPACPTDWEGQYPPSEFYFENFYPDLYRPGRIFAGLPQEYTGDHHVHSLEKVTRRLQQQADYDRNRQLRDASLARAAATELATAHRLGAGDLVAEMRRLPRRLECRPQAVTKLLIEIETTSPAPDREVLLHHRILDTEGALAGVAAYPVDLSQVVADRAAEVVECPIVAPAFPGRYRVEFRLRVDGLELPPPAGEPALELDVL